MTRTMVDLLQAGLDKAKKPEGYDKLSRELTWGEDRGVRELPTVSESPENLKLGRVRPFLGSFLTPDPLRDA